MCSAVNCFPQHNVHVSCLQVTSLAIAYTYTSGLIFGDLEIINLCTFKLQERPRSNRNGGKSNSNQSTTFRVLSSS